MTQTQAIKRVLMDAENGGGPAVSQIKLSNLSLQTHTAAIRKAARSVGVHVLGCRKAPFRSFAFVDVARDLQDQSVLALTNLDIDGQTVEVSKAHPVKHLNNEPRKLKGKARLREEKRQESLAKPEWEALNDKVTPLWRLPYAEQLLKKEEALKEVVCGFLTRLQQADSNGHHPQIEDVLKPIIECPEVGRKDYRNKCEFSVGTTRGGSAAVGFMLGLFKDGEVGVSRPDKCTHVNATHKFFARTFEDYVLTSGLTRQPLYDRELQEGFWRLLMVRTASVTGESLVMVQTHRHVLSDDELLREKENLKTYFLQRCSEVGIKLTSLYWQIHELPHNGIVASGQNDELIYGSPIITETLSCDLDNSFQFSVSPHSFFQSNTPACQVLYQHIHKLATGNTTDDAQQKKIIVLDLCSGTGTIGVCMSHLPSVHRVIGIELIQCAVNDANSNVKRNGISANKIEYICGKVEDSLPAVLDDLSKELASSTDYELVAILDPPRAGTHRSVVNAVRTCPQIKRLIYVSCHPKAASQNWFEMCVSQDNGPQRKRVYGEPFQLVTATPVDLFPDTEHCELVLEFVKQGKVAH